MLSGNPPTPFAPVATSSGASMKRQNVKNQFAIPTTANINHSTTVCARVEPPSLRARHHGIPPVGAMVEPAPLTARRRCPRLRCGARANLTRRPDQRVNPPKRRRSNIIFIEICEQT
jgi:hypothetical protein